jgi:hypothetical protein
LEIGTSVSGESSETLRAYGGDLLARENVEDDDEPHGNLEAIHARARMLGYG